MIFLYIKIVAFDRRLVLGGWSDARRRLVHRKRRSEQQTTQRAHHCRWARTQLPSRRRRSSEKIQISSSNALVLVEVWIGRLRLEISTLAPYLLGPMVSSSVASCAWAPYHRHLLPWTYTALRNPWPGGQGHRRNNSQF